MARVMSEAMSVACGVMTVRKFGRASSPYSRTTLVRVWSQTTSSYRNAYSSRCRPPRPADARARQGHARADSAHLGERRPYRLGLVDQLHAVRVDPHQPRLGAVLKVA
jgi:hypothetical protein